MCVEHFYNAIIITTSISVGLNNPGPEGKWIMLVVHKKKIESQSKNLRPIQFNQSLDVFKYRCTVSILFFPIAQPLKPFLH